MHWTQTTAGRKRVKEIALTTWKKGTVRKKRLRGMQASWDNPEAHARRALASAKAGPAISKTLTKIWKCPEMRNKQAIGVMQRHPARNKRRKEKWLASLRRAQEHPQERARKRQQMLDIWATGTRRVPFRFKGTRYNGTWMRSSWEFAFAKWCRKHGIKYRHEPRWFVLQSGSYLPDFYLPDFNLYIEIKGFLWTGRPDGIVRAKELAETYKVHICVLFKEHLEYLGVL